MAHSRSTWTPEKAREMAVQARAALALKRQQARENAASRHIPPESNPQAALISRQLELVAEEIDRIRAILAPTHRSDRCPTCKRAFGVDARDRAALVKSLDVLLDRQRILAGIPLPGSLKPAKPRESTRPTDWDGLPQAAAPGAPIVLPPAAGTGTTG